jgi:AcrR family transcriptional regulator
MTSASAAAARRSVGRPRQYGEEVERELIIEAGYRALRDHGNELTIAAILASAGISTRSFYRHFGSKDALLCAMFRRDAQWAAARLAERLEGASAPTEAVEMWIDEIFDFVRVARRAERVSLFGSVIANRAAGIGDEQTQAQQWLIAPLRASIAAGISDGAFATADPNTTADLLAVSVMHAAGLSDPTRRGRADQAEVTAFCMRALGARRWGGAAW